ncbi:MAG: hypothetical protein K8L99_09580 [Anaerolineae bacterium]|nr:hypothetical protein [Anaerolineae bacterium]
MIFQYHPEIVERFPDLISGVIVAEGLRNGPTTSPLQALYQAEQQAVIERVGSKSLSEIPSLAAWRSVFRQFGVEPTKYRSAAESLMRRLTKKGDIPTINTLVDIGNLVSIRYALPIAVIDRQSVQGMMTVHFAGGSEHYTELGQDEVIHPVIGEVVFTDETNTVFARRWCWRQSEPSAAQATTTDVIVTIEAHHADSRQDVEQAVQDMLALLQDYAGGSAHFAVLDRNHLSL